MTRLFLGLKGGENVQKNKGNFSEIDKFYYHSSRVEAPTVYSKGKVGYSRGFLKGFDYGHKVDKKTLDGTIDGAKILKKDAFESICFDNGLIAGARARKVFLDKQFVEELHKQYDFDGKRSDREVYNQYVNHMKTKFGGNYKPQPLPTFFKKRKKKINKSQVQFN